MLLTNMSLAQLDQVIEESNSEEPCSASTKGQIEARGLGASELKMKRSTEETILECEDALNEALAWQPLDLENVLVGSYGGEKLAELIGGDVWTHGNLWREDRELTQCVCNWFADYTEGYVTELRKILTELAGTLPS